MKTKLVKRIIAAAGIACCSLCLVTTPVATLPVQAAVAEETIVSPSSVEKEWVFKKENGKLYKRLWNCTYGCWETDWIYVCDL